MVHDNYTCSWCMTTILWGFLDKDHKRELMGVVFDLNQEVSEFSYT